MSLFGAALERPSAVPAPAAALDQTAVRRRLLAAAIPVADAIVVVNYDALKLSQAVFQSLKFA